MKIKSICLTTSCFMCLLWSVNTFAVKEDVLVKLTDSVQAFKNATQSQSGTAIVLIRDGQIIYENYHGYADIEKMQPVDHNTVFYFASTTKAFMGLAALLAEEQGFLNKNTSLADLFPDIQFSYIDPTQYDVKDLLSHTSGLVHEAMTWTFSYTGLHDKQQRDHFIAGLRPSEHTKQGQFEYTNLGYNLMALWFDRHFIGGWQAAMDQLIFAPLSLRQITARVDHARDNQWPIALPYSYKYAQGKQVINMHKRDQTLYSVGVFAQPRAVAELMRQLMPINHASTPFNEFIIKTSQQPLVTDIDSYFSAYGWGWQFKKFAEHKMLFHTGGFDGASVQISYIPEKNMGAVIVHNESGLIANTLNSLVTSLAFNIMLDQPIDDDLNQLKNNMVAVKDTVKKSQLKLSAKRTKLINQTNSTQHQLNLTAGTYTHPEAGLLEINRSGGSITINWGELTSVVYAGEKPGELVFEFRPGQFITGQFSQSTDVKTLKIKDWKFMQQMND